MRNALVLPVVLVAAACGSSTPGTPAASPTPPSETKTASPPVAEVRSVTNTYHGVDVVDSYQWLERDDDPEVKAWANGQNAHARAALNALPNLPAVRAQIAALWTEPVPGYGGWQVRGTRVFALARLPPKEQRVLVEFDDATSFGGQRIVLDPTKLSDDVTTSFDYVEVSPDGTKVAVSISRNGSEAGDLAVFDTTTGARLPDTIPGVNYGTAGGDLTWLADSSGFFYARYPRPDERPGADLPFYQTLWFHELGTPVADDKQELGSELTRLAQVHTKLRKETGELLATVQNGDSGGVAHWLRSPKGTWTQLSTYDDQIQQVVFGNPGELFAISFAGTPRGKVVRLTKGALDLSKARVVIPESSDALNYSFWYDEGIVVTPKRLYVGYQLGGPVALRAFDHAGKRMSDPPQLEVAAIGDPNLIQGEEIFYRQTGYLEPPSWYRFDAASNKGSRIDAVSARSSVDFSDAVVRREMATSADGTKVPVNIVMRADHPLDGSRPCIATGYGGYGLSETPSFRESLRVSLDRGVCFAYSNLRGGGEFGEEWHRQGMLTKKQNVFDDFAAVLKLLVSRGYTSAERLGIIGGSNGGLLMGAMLTQHPELFRAVVSSVGIYDSLRTELEANGEFNIPEFGTVKDEAQFRALHAYSPYHHVEPGTGYPAVLLSHGDNDPRVAPWQSRKMVAALQAANVSDQPIFLMTSASAGHGAGSLTEAIDQYSRKLAFLLHHIGAAEPAAN